MNPTPTRRRANLVRIATESMAARGLEPEIPAAVHRQLASLGGPGTGGDTRVSDMRALLWCSIDNDESRDLDQVTACEALADGEVKVFLAVADVDALFEKGSAIDEHARFNTTSVWTAARTFSMLPERLSTDLTLLNPGQDRLVIVTTLKPGDRVLISCICTRGRCAPCQKGMTSQCTTGGWILDHSIGSTQAVFVRIPHAGASRHPIPAVADERTLVMLSFGCRVERQVATQQQRGHRRIGSERLGGAARGAFRAQPCRGADRADPPREDGHRTASRSS